MNINKSITGAFLLMLILSCNAKKPSSITTIDILEGLSTEKEFLLSEFVDDVEYVKLETNPECLLSWANYLVGKKYIVAIQSYNPGQVYLFDRFGKYLRKIGAEGKGPQEYTSISSVTADPEETYILVNDYQRDIILKYDFDGNVISQYNYKEKLDADVAGIVCKSTDEIFFRLDFPRLEKKNMYLIRKVDSNFNPLDSLLPVDCPKIEGNGFSWGSSDFYLYQGSIQFRQFSFDTLFGEEKGKLVPRFYLPVGADHLPGPYLVRGLHKQMYDYTSVLSVNELPGYLFLDTRIAPNKGGPMIFNKSTGEISLIKKYPPCPPDTLPGRFIINDIDGIVNPGRISSENGQFVMSHQIIDIKDRIKENCAGERSIKFPVKRQEMIGLVNSSKDDDNPVLQIFHLKR